MMGITSQNVNQSYATAISLIREKGERSPSRAGDVLVMPSPVVTETRRPTERVLFDARRDANPFFHFFECIWMIVGSNDGTLLDRFVSDFSERFGEIDGTIWGAYGHRWRHHFDVDQLEKTVELLRANPHDRRVVIAMWDPQADLASEECTDSGLPARDVPCNTHAYPRIREEDGRSVLDLTVCVRSNDIIWGAYGANAVHLSFLQEYLAGRIGVDVGTLYQFSNNWHAYVETLDKVGEPDPSSDYYSMGLVSPMPIGADWVNWDSDAHVMLGMFRTDIIQHPEFSNRWFADVAVPMLRAHRAYKSREFKTAIEHAKSVMASDWSRAAVEWLERRAARASK